MTKYPVFSALTSAAAGFTGDELSSIIRQDNEQTTAAWNNVQALLKQYGLDADAQEAISEAMIEYGRAESFLSFQNGIRIAHALREELREITAPAL